MKNLLSGPVIINAVLFQVTWFTCVFGAANNLSWPALIACAVLAFWQLHPKRRHPSDLKLVFVAVVLGLIVDSLWIHAGFMEFKAQWPSAVIAPAWIIALWVGFALTLNHSLAWLSAHPLLPAIMGMIGGPLSYLAGLRLGAVNYLDDTLLISTCLGVAWALSMVVMTRVGRSSATTQCSSETEKTVTA